MKQFFPFILLLASCSTLHKVVNKEKKTVDSTAVVVTDTSYKSVQASQTNDLQLSDVDVTILYGPNIQRSNDSVYAWGRNTAADTALAKAKAVPVDRTPMKTGNSAVDKFAELFPNR